MANDEDLARLRQGVAAWNKWREQNLLRDVDLSGANLGKADLSGADLGKADLGKADLSGANLGSAHLYGANLSGADLSGARLSTAHLNQGRLFGANLSGANLTFAALDDASFHGANLSGANLFGANLPGARLHKANLEGANLGSVHLNDADLSFADLTGARLQGAGLGGARLQWANLRGADLSGADLSDVNLREADLSGARLCKAKFTWASLNNASLNNADLSGADLSSATLIEANLTKADLTGCRIYGISAWDLKLEGASQRDLVVTRFDQPEITVDNIEVGQFLYLLLHNEKIRGIIDTITSKAVLILGRFTEERKAVLDSIREDLRKRHYLPILFDFKKPDSKDLTGTMSTLAHMARFIIADLTDPSCVPYELATVLSNTFVPVKPILLSGKSEFAMISDLRRRYHWVLPTYPYDTQEHLIAKLNEQVILPAEAKVRELRGLTSGISAPSPFP